MITNLLFDFACGCSLLVFRNRGRGLEPSFRTCALHADYNADDLANLAAALPLSLVRVKAASQPSMDGGGDGCEVDSLRRERAA